MAFLLREPPSLSNGGLMIRTVFAITLSLALSSSAYAWRIGTLHGDDPDIHTFQIPTPIPVNITPIGIIPTPKAVEQAKTDATNAGNLGKKGVADTLRNLHVQDVLDHNAETIAHVGAAGACIATLCYSEEVRRRELAEEKDEQDRKFRSHVHQIRNEMLSNEQAARAQEIQIRKHNAAVGMKTLTEALVLEKKEIALLVALKTAIGTEINFRVEFNKNHLPLDGIEDHEIPVIAREFSLHFRKNLTQASLSTHAELSKLASAKRKSVARLESELLRALTATDLQSFSEIITARLDRSQKLISKMNIQLCQMQKTAAADAVCNGIETTK